MPKNTIKSATRDLRERLKPVFDGLTSVDDYEREGIEKAIEECYQFIYYHNGRFNEKASNGYEIKLNEM